MKIELFMDKKLAWRVRVVGANGEIMQSSESFANKSNARRHARRLKWGLALAKIVVVS